MKKALERICSRAFLVLFFPFAAYNKTNVRIFTAKTKKCIKIRKRQLRLRAPLTRGQANDHQLSGEIPIFNAVWSQ